MAAIENTVKGASGISGAIAAVSSATVTLATMGTEVKTTVVDLQGLDAKGELKSALTSSAPAHPDEPSRLVNATIAAGTAVAAVSRFATGRGNDAWSRWAAGLRSLRCSWSS